MIDALDVILQRLLMDAVAEVFDPPTTLSSHAPAGIVFDAPDSAFRNVVKGASGPLLNVYLADVRENRKLRTNDRVEFAGKAASESQAPARLDCHYLISAWSPADQMQDGENVVSEHRLLYNAAAGLLRHNPIVARHVFGDIPITLDALNDNDANWRNTVAANNPTLSVFYSLDPVLRDMELPADVMPPEGFHRLGEFWGLMGGNALWHPSAYVIITLPIERLRTFSGPPVRSIGTIYDRPFGAPDKDATETRYIVAGTVARPKGRPVARVWATLRRQAVDPNTGVAREFIERTLTDEKGHFVFENQPPGPVELSGGGALKANVNVPPQAPGEYDLITP